MSAFWSRIVVALVLLPAVIGLVYLGGWWLWALVLVASLIALHELYAMGAALRPLRLGGYAGALAGLLGMQLGGVPWLLAGMLSTLLFAFLVFLVSQSRPSFTAATATTLLGVIWVVGGLACLLLVREIPEFGLWALVAVMFTVFANDTFAYFVGRAIGRHRMAPAISPGKSWEGFVGGTLAAVGVAFLILYRDREEFLSISESLALGAAVAVGGVLGDLFESAVKRDLGVKDSGRILAGHGGMLDRLDALLFAGPVAYVMILAFGAT
ncbi:MAG TPA: phosphatidate cytidylyltransferase [Gaiella sp.]|jgi:phosphatidate cytidylyltransferase